MRRFAVLMLILLIASFGPVAADNRKVEVVFWHAMGGPLGDALVSLVSDFNRSQDEVFVKAINMGNYGALSTKLFAALQTEQKPDVAQAFESWTANFVDNDKIVAFDDYMDAATRADIEKDVFPVFLQSNTLNGKLWSFPFNKSVRVLFYNKDLFFANGLDHNHPPVTWDEFRQYCRVLTKRTPGSDTAEVYGTTLTVSAWQFENLLLQAGGRIMSSDLTTPLFHEAPGVEGLRFLTDLLNVDKTALLTTGYDGQNYFQSGKVAMLESSSVSMAYMLQTGIDFNLGIAAIPVRDTLKTNIVSGTNVVIFRSGDKQREQAAWTFVRWFTDTAQTAKWSYDTWYMPVRKSALNDKRLQERFAANPEIARVYDQLNHATWEPQLSQWFKARDYLEEQVIEKVFLGEVSPDVALRDASQKVAVELLGEDAPKSEKKRSNPWHVAIVVAVPSLLLILLIWGISRLRSR